MLQILIGLIVLIFFTWVPGAAVTRALFGAAGPPTTEKRERAFLSVAVSVLLTGWLGFTLAEIGWFSVWLLLFIELAICFGLLVWAGGGVRDVPNTLRDWVGGLRATTTQAIRRPSWQVLVLLGLLILGGVLYSRPAEMIRGALDAGAYINAGVALGRTGDIVQRDQLMRELYDGSPAGAPEEGREFLQPLSATRYTFDRLRMPAFYVFDKQDAQVLPQHYSYFPTWIAIFYQLFGLWGALWASPYLALIASAAIYFFAARIFTRSVGLLALGLLVVFPLQSWFARYPVSETPTQLLAFVFFYAFARFLGESQRLTMLEGQAADTSAIPETDELERATRSVRFFALLSALAVVSIAFTRPDFPAFVIPVPLFMFWWWLTRGWRREHTWFAIALLVLFGQWLLHFFFFTYGYTMDLYYNTIRNFRRAWPRTLPAFYIGVILLVALGLLRRRLQPIGRAAGDLIMRLRPWLLGGLAALTGLYLFWRYLWEPAILTPSSIWGAITSGTIPFDWQGYIGAPLKSVAETGKSNQEGLINTDSFILVRIGWYLSPLGILAGSVGLIRALLKRLNAASTAFFISFAVLLVVFVGETFTDPTYPYTMRRFMPVVIPAFLIFSAYALAWMGEKLRPRLVMRSIGWLAYAALAVFFVFTSLPMLTHTEEQGAIAQVEDLISRLPNPSKTVLLFSQERDEPYIVATPLQYIYGFEVFSLNRPYGETNPATVQCAIERWMRQGYQVFAVLGSNGGKLELPPPNPTQPCYRSSSEPGKDVPDTTLALKPLEGDPSWTYNVPEFEHLYTQKPKNIQRSILNWGLYNIVPVTDTVKPAWPYSLDIGGFDYDHLLAGFAEKECHQLPDKSCDPAAGYWRWTLQNGILKLPWSAPSGQGATLTLKLAAGPVQRATPATVQVFVGAGKNPVGAATVQPGADFTDYTFTIPPQEGDSVLIRINSTTWAPSDAGVSADNRALGVQVDEVSLR